MDSENVIPYEQSPIDARQETRMAEVPELYRQKHERLALELACAMDDADAIFARHGYTQEQAIELAGSPAFLALLQRTTDDVRTNGTTFRLKARAQAEELLATSFEMATDPTVSSAVRADLVKWTALMAGHNPKVEKDDGKSSGGLTLSITFAGQAPQTVVAAHEAITIDQEG